MRTSWVKAVSLVSLLVMLVAIPALAISPSEVQDQTLFPRTGDTVDIDSAPYWWHEDDYAEGWRTFPELPEMGRLQYDLQMDYNSLNSGGHCDFRLFVNNINVAEFSVFEGEMSKWVDTAFDPVTGPDYKFTLDLLNTVETDKGSIRIPLDLSNLYVYPPQTCPATKALARTGDEARVDMLYRFRNEMLSTDRAMSDRLDAYYTYAPEATSILSSHPLLLLRTADILRKAAPSVEALVEGKGDQVSVPARDLRAAYRLLDDLSELASPEFAESLQELRGLIEAFEDCTVTEGWNTIASQ